MSSPVNAPLIVLATDSEIPSGVGEHMLTLALAIRDTYRVALAFAPSSEGACFLRRAVGHGFEAKPIGSNVAFSRWLKSASAAVLHVHAGIGWEGHGLANAGWMAGVPVIRTEHLPYLLTDAAQIDEHRLSVGLVQRLCFVSEATAESYRHAGFAGSSAAVVQNGIDEPSPTRSRAAIRMMLDIDDDNDMVITVARFTPQKNYPLLLAAARLVCERMPSARFVWVGDGPERAAIEERATAAGPQASITLLGERDDVPDLLMAADLFVLPSLFEGLPLVLLEAMALGLPVVATRIGGTREAIGDDYPWLVAANDTDALAGAIVHALSNPQERTRVGAANRNRFEQCFRAERMGRDMIELYRAVVPHRIGVA
jgi:glycosyltransferase involved in cell wall biosynthesis